MLFLRPALGLSGAFVPFCFRAHLGLRWLGPLVKLWTAFGEYPLSRGTQNLRIGDQGVGSEVFFFSLGRLVCIGMINESGEYE